MKPADQYGVTLAYGATSAPYSQAKPHRGRDRGCPSGSPLIVGGQTIGLTGATGYVFGAHLHTQEWSGGYANTRNPQNEFKTGKIVNVDNAGTQGDGSFGKFITVQTSDGWNDTYCHLSQINVKVGDVIKQGEQEMSFWNSTIDNKEEERQVFLAWVGRNPLPQEVGRYVGKKVSDVWGDIARNQSRQTMEPIFSYVRDNGKLPDDVSAAQRLSEIKKLVN